GAQTNVRVSASALSTAPAQIAGLGAGSWGAALAIHLARADRGTVRGGPAAAHLARRRAQRRNLRYLPDAPFADALRIEPDLARALQSSRDVLIAVPSHAFRSTLQAAAAHLAPNARVAWATKGFELATGLLPHEVAKQVL